MLRIPTKLSPELETLIHRVIGCCIMVHRGLGPGLLERIYIQAVCMELKEDGIAIEREKRYPVTYRGEMLWHQRVDLAVENQLILEIKSVEALASVHTGQVRTYLRVSALPVGLLVNFNVGAIPDGLKRIVV